MARSSLEPSSVLALSIGYGALAGAGAMIFSRGFRQPGHSGPGFCRTSRNPRCLTRRDQLRPCRRTTSTANRPVSPFDGAGAVRANRASAECRSPRASLYDCLMPAGITPKSFLQWLIQALARNVGQFTAEASLLETATRFCPMSMPLTELRFWPAGADACALELLDNPDPERNRVP